MALTLLLRELTTLSCKLTHLYVLESELDRSGPADCWFPLPLYAKSYAGPASAEMKWYGATYGKWSNFAENHHWETCRNPIYRSFTSLTNNNQTIIDIDLRIDSFHPAETMLPNSLLPVHE